MRLLGEMFGKWVGLLWEQVAPAMPAMVTSFFSVLIGAMPFIVIAVFASAILEVYVSKDAIARLVPRQGVVGVLFAPVLGAVIPMCECGIVPVARRMIQKGVPGSAAITFMLANPIINPLAIYSTYLAFPWAREMVLWRVGLGYVIAVLIGLMIELGLNRHQREAILQQKDLIPAAAAAEGAGCDCGHDHGALDHDHSHHGSQSAGEKLQACLHHAATEFFDVSKYFIIGAGIAAVSQAVISRQLLETIGGGAVLSVLIMIAFAYIICICSEADAFVAATFASTFTPGALLAFLVAGPMTDIKNTMIMLASFRQRFVIFLNVAILSLTAALTIAINLWLKWGG